MKSSHRALAARRRVRESVLKALYAAETGGEPILQEGLPPAAQNRFEAETKSVQEEAERWDACFAPHLAPGWGVERVGLIERLLLRMASWELWEALDVPPKVTLSEHVALARKYVDGAGASFVHGVLGSLVAASPKADGGSEPASDEGWLHAGTPNEADEKGADGPGWTLKAE